MCCNWQPQQGPCVWSQGRAVPLPKGNSLTRRKGEGEVADEIVHILYNLFVLGTSLVSVCALCSDVSDSL